MLLVLSLSLFETIGTFAAWVIIGIWVLRGPEEAVEGLLLSLLLTFTNPGLFLNREIATFARWFILIEASIRIAIAWFQHPVSLPPWSKFLFIFTVYVFLTSIFISTWSTISLIKLASFTILVMTTYMGVKMGKKNFGTTFIAFGVVIALLSIPLLSSPLGYLRNGTQFQGILSHPQSYGVIISIPLALAFGRWLLDIDTHFQWYHIFFLGVMLITVILSSARTGYFALILALITSLLLYRRRGRYIRQLLFSPLSYFGLAIIMILIWQTNPTDQIQQFIFERDANVYASYELSIDPNSSVAAHLFASRSTLAERSWSNFLEHPTLGIGFGIPSRPEFLALATIVAGIPISLPAEKGFMVTAVLEEVGLIGFVFLSLMIFSQFHVIQKSIQISAIILFLTALFVNLGESLYFAPGGIGVLVHIAVATALVSVEQQRVVDIPVNNKNSIHDIHSLSIQSNQNFINR